LAVHLLTGQAKGFLQEPSAKTTEELLSQHKPANIDEAANMALSFKWASIKMGLVDSPGCGRCK